MRPKKTTPLASHASNERMRLLLIFSDFESVATKPVQFQAVHVTKENKI